MTGAAGDNAATRQAEAVITHAYSLFRLGGLVEVGLAMAPTLRLCRPLPLGLGVAVLIAVESGVLIAVAQRRRQPPPPWMILADLPILIAAMVVNAYAASPAYGNTWVFFMYPFTLLCMAGVGVALPTALAAAMASLAPAAAYMSVAIAFLGEPLWNAAPNGASFVLNASVAYVVAGMLRRGARQVDEAAVRAAAQEAELAVGRDRAKQARLLHNRVLQTLETLSVGDWLAGSPLRAAVAGDAAWLRAFVRGESPEGADHLPEALAALAVRCASQGVIVDVHTEQLRSALAGRPPLPPDFSDCVLGAVAEALNNVVKHAGVDRATVRAEIACGRLVVTVVDRGRGFPAAEPAPGGGTGVARCIQEPVHAAGGSTTIESKPGAGTYIELLLPLPPLPAEALSAAAATPRRAGRR